jgi:hypothetical protein
MVKHCDYEQCVSTYTINNGVRKTAHEHPATFAFDERECFGLPNCGLNCHLKRSNELEPETRNVCLVPFLCLTCLDPSFLPEDDSH